MTALRAASAIACLLLAACRDDPAEGPVAQAGNTPWPESLNPFGDGYPNAGDSCRTVGESPATTRWLDASRLLVGCPDRAAAEALDGEIVDTVDGITLVSIPMGEENFSMPTDGATSDSGREFDASAIVSCGFDGAPATGDCDARVVRNWGEDNRHLVEVTKPDGRKRAIFYDGTTPTGADGTEADGSAGWSFETERKVDEVTVRYGPETYVLFDALITGG